MLHKFEFPLPRLSKAGLGPRLDDDDNDDADADNDDDDNDDGDGDNDDEDDSDKTYTWVLTVGRFPPATVLQHFASLFHPTHDHHDQYDDYFNQPDS